MMDPSYSIYFFFNNTFEYRYDVGTYILINFQLWNRTVLDFNKIILLKYVYNFFYYFKFLIKFNIDVSNMAILFSRLEN